MSESVSTPRIDRIEGDVMPVNTYLVHGPDGLVIVDGQLTLSDAAKVRSAVDAAGAPVAGLLITHPHPDHYAGAARVLEGLDAPIIATSAVDAVIRRDDVLKDSIVGPMMGEEWPQLRRFPDRLVEHGATVRLGGLDFRAYDVGPGESHHDTLWMLGTDAVFVGDVAYNQMHAYLADGWHQEWIALLRRLRAELDPACTLYVGHGAPGTLDLLEAQEAYVAEFVAAVRDSAKLDTSAQMQLVTERMKRLVPNDDLLFLLELSVGPAADAS